MSWEVISKATMYGEGIHPGLYLQGAKNMKNSVVALHHVFQSNSDRLTNLGEPVPKQSLTQGNLYSSMILVATNIFIRHQTQYFFTGNGAFIDQ